MMSKQVKQYFDGVIQTRRKKIDTLHRLITSMYPDVVVDMKYKMPTYQVGDGWVAIANQKNYVSLYTCGYQHIESFRSKHPAIKTGKGCINFRDKDELPIEDIRQVVQHAIEHPKDVPGSS